MRTRVYLDGQREKVDLLKRLDLHVLDQAAQLGNGEPLRKKKAQVTRASSPVLLRARLTRTAQTYLLVLGLASASSAASAPAPTIVVDLPISPFCSVGFSFTFYSSVIWCTQN